MKPPASPGGRWAKVKLRYIWGLMKQNWNVKVILRFGQDSYHAVFVDEFIMDGPGRIKAVRIYDSNVGRIIEIPAVGFQKMIADANVTGYSILTAFKFE